MAKRFTTQLFVSSMLQLCTSPVFLLFSVFEFLFSNCSLAGLSAYTTDQSLRQLFAPFGQITESNVLRL